MHSERPEGSATLRDLLRVLGPMWADLNHRHWDDSAAEPTDPASTDAGVGILEFVTQIDRHCGLLVERAPGRWGFAHLTFEEFYAGRALAFPERPRDRPVKIRQRLHDPRYDEPILLALGLVGREHVGDLDDLLTTALLAETDEARELGLTPTPLEELLGRDFRFVLRALADDIRAKPKLVDSLLDRALSELLHAAGRGRFGPYRHAVLERLRVLKAIPAGTRATNLVAQRLAELPATDRERQAHIVATASVCHPHPGITDRLTLIATSGYSSEAILAAEVLAGQGELGDSVVARLVELITTSADSSEASQAAHVLAGQGQLGDSVVAHLVELVAAAGNSFEAIRASQVLAGQAELSDSVVTRLVELVATAGYSSEASRAVNVLAGQGELGDSVVARLVELVATSADSSAAIRAAEVLALATASWRASTSWSRRLPTAPRRSGPRRCWRGSCSLATASWRASSSWSRRPPRASRRPGQRIFWPARGSWATASWRASSS